MQAISSKNNARSYLRSSSFKMALLFTILLGLSAGVLGYFSYYFNRTHYIESAGAVLDTEIHYLQDDRAGLPEKLQKAERPERTHLSSTERQGRLSFRKSENRT